MAGFPQLRLRRFRRTPALRGLVRETRLSVEQLVAPLFVRSGRKLREAISSLPGVARLSPDEAVAEARGLHALGIPAVLLFGIPDRKDETGSEAWNDAAPLQDAVRRIKDAVPGMAVMTDVCLDEYTSPGTAASCGTATWTTTRRCRCWRARPSRTRGPGPTWSRRRT